MLQYRIIASVFYKAGLIENWGRGTINIINECLKAGLPKPSFEYEWTAVKLTFYKAQVEAQVELNETEKKVLHYLLKENLSSKELVSKLGLISLSGALKNALKHLLELNLIQYTIPDKPKSRNQKYKRNTYTE